MVGILQDRSDEHEAGIDLSARLQVFIIMSYNSILFILSTHLSKSVRLLSD